MTTRQRPQVRREDTEQGPTTSAQIDYATRFQKAMGRVPTREDLQEVMKKLSAKANGATSDGFNSAIQTYVDDTSAFKDVNHEDVESAISQLAEETRKDQERKEQRKRTFWRGVKSSTKGLVASVLIATSAGIGTAVYQGTREPVVIGLTHKYEEKQQQLEEKSRELDQKYAQQVKDLTDKFYGPLDDLTKITEQSTYPINQRESILEKLGDSWKVNYRQNTDVLYDQVIGEVRVFVRPIVVTDNPGTRYERKETVLKIVKMDPKTNAIIEFYTVSEEGLYNAVIFKGKQAIVVDFNEKSATVYEGDKVVYRAYNDLVNPYKELARRIYNEFITLHNRGPNVPQIQKQ